MDLGNDYTAVCGQLKELQVVEMNMSRATFWAMCEPTKYYSIEGNLYFELEHENYPGRMRESR